MKKPFDLERLRRRRIARMKMKRRAESLDIKQLRKRLGMKQAAFAELMGVNQATVSKWETGSIAVSRLARKALERLKQEAA